MRPFRLSIFLLTLLTVAGMAGAAHAEKRIALIIGNGTYPSVGNLDNPPNDARLMAKTLRQVGFDVIERIDADQKAMKKAIKAFGSKLQEAGKDSVGLFYYAGHGVQVGGINYLIPVNVDINDEADVSIEAVSANDVQVQMAYAGSRLNIIIMDACRNNPFKRGFRSTARGLARMGATKGTLIAYATSPGDVAADGSGKNSPYTLALSKALLSPNLTVERVFKQVRNDVVAATNSKQVPWESSSLTGADFYFKGGASTPSQVQQGSSSPPPSVDKEAMFWNSIQGSTDPTMFEAYLEQYPGGSFAALARAKQKKYGQQQVAVVMPPNPASVLQPQNLTDNIWDGTIPPYSGPTLRNLKMQTFSGGGSMLSWNKKFVSEVNSGAGGQFSIDLLSVNSVVRSTQIPDAVSQGILDMGWIVGSYMHSKSPAFSLMFSTPFGPPPAKFALWRINEGDQIYNDLLQNHGLNIIALACGAQGPEGQMWTNQTPGSLRGLKIRNVGIFADVFQDAGASVVRLPGGEIQPAMRSGLIDAANFNRPWADLSFGMQDVAKRYYYPSVANVVGIFDLIVNRHVWERLTPSGQAYIRAQCRKNIVYSLEDDKRQEVEALQTFRQRHGVQVVHVPARMEKELRSGWRSVKSRLSRNPDVARVLQAVDRIPR